jgi:hypothetical protein
MGLVRPLIVLSCLLVSRHRLRDATIAGAVASLGPAYWIAHNWILFSNPLEFYNGYWSAQAIYQRARQSGMAPYPGDHNWPQAFQYFIFAGRHCLGWPLAVLSIAGPRCLFKAPG